METTEKKTTFQDMINQEQPTLVDFYATWCGPCQVMAPRLVELSGRVKGKATVLKIDVDKNDELAAHYQIHSIPTLILFKKGKPVWRQAGVLSVEQLEKIISENA